ncbi:MAG: hypothetical protein ACK4NM_02045 [Hydrogenophaga sp.]
MKSTVAHPGSTSTTGSRTFGGVRSAHLQGLADHLPSQFKNLRAQRYQGQDQDALLSVLSRADQERIRSLYEYAKGVHLCWLSMRDKPDWGVLRAKVLALLSPPLRAAAQDLGRDTLAHTSDGDATLALGKVLHDLRGGALMSLQLYAHMAEWDTDPAPLRGAAYLARDQAKIMRNALPDLDPEVRSADEAEKPHFMQTVVEKWDGFRFEGADQQAGQVDISCEYDGLLASCCLEASAVDRVVYNYVNNATRFSAGSNIFMEILPIGEHTVRWIVANPITRDQAQWLRQETGGDLSQLFRGGMTRGGNGLGLSNCADFVAAAFGLPDIDSALQGRYLGAMVEDGWYLAWAHWPALYPDGSARPFATQ